MQRSLHDYLTGGPVRGPGTATSDSILARLSNGEYVLPKVAVDQVGVQNLEAIRRAALAKTPKLALGGPISGGLNFQDEQDSAQTDAFGNDLSLTNRMNSGAEAMRTMREGSAAPPAKPADDFATTLAKALQGNDPAKQADEARKAAQAKADPLDVASGRFDREYAPGMAAGGLISQAQWEGLPKFEWGGLANFLFGTPKDKPADILEVPPQVKEIRAAREQESQQTKGLPAADIGTALFGKGYDPSIFTRAIPTVPPGFKDIGNSIQSGWKALENTGKNIPVIPDMPNLPPPMEGEEATRLLKSLPAQLSSAPAPSASPPSVPTLPAPLSPLQESPSYNARRLAEQEAARPLMGSLADNAALVRAAQTESSFNKGRVAATDYANQSPGRTVVDALPTGTREGQSVVAAPSRPIGTQSYTTGQPFEPSQGTAPPPPLMGSQRIMSGNGVTGPVTTGGSNVPIYQTDYTVFGPKGQQGTLSVTGPDQRVGGGTVSQPDQGNGGTVEGNVAALNRQIDALRSLREARNPGITTGGSALPEAPAPVDIWARPGDSFGDSQMRQARYEGLLKDAANQTGLGAKRRSAALIDAATGLLAPGAASAKLAAEQQQAANSLAGQLAQARAQQEASKYGADVGLAGHKYTADATLAGSRLKAEQEAQQSKTKNDIDLANAMSARISATARNALPAEKQMLLQLVDAYSKLDPKSAEGQRLKLLIDALNPPRNQDSLVNEIAKSQEESK